MNLVEEELYGSLSMNSTDDKQTDVYYNLEMQKYELEASQK